MADGNTLRKIGHLYRIKREVIAIEYVQKHTTISRPKDFRGSAEGAWQLVSHAARCRDSPGTNKVVYDGRR